MPERIETGVDLQHGWSHRRLRLEDRDFWAPLSIELQHWHSIGLSEDLSHGSHKNLPDGLFVLKLYLSLGGMDVHINFSGVHFEIEEIGHLHVAGDNLAESLRHCLGEIGVAHVASVDEEVLVGALLACRLRLAHKSPDTHHGSGHIHIEQLAIELPTEDIEYPGAQTGCRKFGQRIPVVGKREGHRRIDQCNAFKFLHDVAELRLVALEKLAASRHIEKDVTHQEIGTHWARAGRLGRELGAINKNFRAHLLLQCARAHLHMCHSGNGRECLSPEAHGAEREQVIGLLDFGSGMAFEGHACIGVTHALAIVHHLNERTAGILHHHINAGSTRINGILHQFLHYRSRALNHLTSRYLVGNRVGQKMYDVHVRQKRALPVRR